MFVSSSHVSVALFPLKRDALAALLQYESGHLTLGVNLELYDWPSGIRKAGL